MVCCSCRWRGSSGSGNSFARLLCCPAQAERGRKKAPSVRYADAALGDRTCAVIRSSTSTRAGPIPRSPDGGNRRRPQPSGGIRSRIADRLRAPTRVDQGLTTPPSHRASNVSRRRLRLEVGLAILSVLLFFATLLWPEWIEIVFGVDPD